MREILDSLKMVYEEFTYKVISVLSAVLVLLVYYAVLVSSTPWEIFIASNGAFYIFAQIVLSIINAALIGLVVAMALHVIEKRKQESNLTFVQAAASLLFSVAATGCTVCGAVLLPTLGIAASLTALPLAGLEIKLLTILLLVYSIYEYAKLINGKCEVKLSDGMQVTNTKEEYTLKLNKQFLYFLKPLAVVIFFFAILLLLPKLPQSWKVNFAKDGKVAVAAANEVDVKTDDLLAQINPEAGYDLGITYKDFGPKLVKAGAIDLEGFKQVYENSGQPLTEEQLNILTNNTDANIVINSDNSYFLLNFFWAFGLANMNPILTEGEIAQYGQGQIEGFASTGGWSLASKDFKDYYSQTKLVSLTEEQQQLVEEVSSNIYRPCCGNPTSFPDCNHGMALLGVLQAMAANGASEDELYEASKYINAFWFPSTYNDLAMYFKSTEGIDFKDIDAKTILGSEYSSGSGYQSKKAWMQQQGILPEPPQTSGGGCGV